MVLHVLGVGAVGSLLAVHLSKYSNQAVKLIVRKGGRYNDLLRQNRDLTIERDGQQIHVDNVDVELIAPVRTPTEGLVTHPFISDKVLHGHRLRDEQRQSLGGIDSLFVTTKGPAVLPALQQLLPRLSTDSTIVLLQNGGGIVDSLISNLFPDENLRPNFVVGVNTHGSYLKSVRRPMGTTSAMHTVWAGVGSIPFGVVPNLRVQNLLKEAGRWDSNPITNSINRKHPSLDYLPAASPTQSLRSTISSMLACQPLNFEWLSLPELLRVQQQKIAINCVINPLTAIFDVQNGVLVEQHIEHMAYQICYEVGRVFAEQARRELTKQMEMGHQIESEDDAILLEQGRFPPGHALSIEALHARAMQVARMTDANVSSTLADIRNGVPRTEIDFMNGYISKLGQELNIATPVNDMLVQMVNFKASLGRLAKRQPRGIPRNLPNLRISDRYGSTYKPQNIRVRHKKRLSQDLDGAVAGAQNENASESSEHTDDSSKESNTLESVGKV